MNNQNFIPGSPETDLLVVVSSSKGVQANGNLKKGNTQVFAEKIAELTGADLFILEPEEEGYYPDNFMSLMAVAKKEIRGDIRPAYKNDVPDFGKYRTVFIGGPAWFMRWPMITYTFLDRHDPTGINLVPFTTYVGHADGIQTQLKADFPQANHRTYLALKGADAQKMKKETEAEIRNWLSNMGYLK